MKLLVLYRSAPEPRKTIDDHLFAFGRYLPDAHVCFCDVHRNIPAFIRKADWDGVILHYTLLAERFERALWPDGFERLADALAGMRGCKIAMPQDEYYRTEELWRLFRNGGVKTVYTCANPIDYDLLYPLNQCGIVERVTTFTGFVDERSIPRIEALAATVSRKVDIGYRARKTPFWLGRHATIKWEIGERIAAAAAGRGLKLDISTDGRDVFFGDEWMKFLLGCRATLGCLGGASLLDSDGSVQKRVDLYLSHYPQASFDEVEASCFPGLDGGLHLFAISPRHFECAMARTCQVLMEGDYQGVLFPGRHYIELKSDYSNIEEVFDQVSDKGLCSEIADRAYDDVVASGRFTYAAFVRSVADHVEGKGSTSVPLAERFLYLQKRAAFHGAALRVGRRVTGLIKKITS